MKIGRWSARIIPRTLAGATAVVLAAPLAAETASGTMAVTTIVEQSCHLDAQPLRFATTPGEHRRIEARSSIRLSCTPAASYAVTLDTGRHGADGTRRMADATGTNFRAYELYSDAVLSRRWGAAASHAVGGLVPVGGIIELAVFGRLSSATSAPGEYGDTITITVAF